MEKAYIVTDLGFGDAGKGLVVDHLVRREGARLVVRHNGGAQAGHNVVTPDGRHHCFAQIGAGSFVPGARTHLARDFVLHPTALWVEAQQLASKGVPDALERVEVDERARVITPYHQAACRLRELWRGDARHGSCGVGIGEAVADALSAGEDAIRARDLRDPSRLLRKMKRTRDRVLTSLEAARTERERDGVDRGQSAASDALHDELQIFQDTSMAARWIEATRALMDRITLVDAGALTRELAKPGAVVFEGAQGVLLDERWGFHPHTTWSRTTSENARGLLAEAGCTRTIHSLGVLRSYSVRHGAGPMPSESIDVALDAERERHNRRNAWQGSLRRGALDLVMLRYALEVDGHIDALVVTHLDALEGRERWPVVTAYSDDEGALTRLPVPEAPTLAGQAALGRRLASVDCEMQEIAASEAISLEDSLIQRLQAGLGRQVRGRGHGPTADGLQID